MWQDNLCSGRHTVAYCAVVYDFHWLRPNIACIQNSSLCYYYQSTRSTPSHRPTMSRTALNKWQVSCIWAAVSEFHHFSLSSDQRLCTACRLKHRKQVWESRAEQVFCSVQELLQIHGNMNVSVLSNRSKSEIQDLPRTGLQRRQMAPKRFQNWKPWRLDQNRLPFAYHIWK